MKKKQKISICTSINYLINNHLIILGLTFLFIAISCSTEPSSQPSNEISYSKLEKAINNLAVDVALRSELIIIPEGGCEWCYETATNHYLSKKSEQESPLVVLISNRKKAKKTDYHLLDAIPNEDFMLSNNLTILSELSQITNSPKGPYKFNINLNLISNVSEI
jgi:hypothetical protein